MAPFGRFHLVKKLLFEGMVARRSSPMNRLIARRLCSVANESLAPAGALDGETSRPNGGKRFFFCYGDAVYQQLVPSEEEEGSIIDTEAAVMDLTSNKFLTINSLEDGELKELAKLKQRDLKTFLKTLGRPLMPQPPGSSSAEVKMGRKKGKVKTRPGQVYGESSDSTPYWPRVQIGVFPEAGFAFMSLFNGQGNVYNFDTSKSFGIYCQKSMSADMMQHTSDISEGGIFENSISAESYDELKMRSETHYERVKFLGSGAQSSVFEGKARWDKHAAALKVLDVTGTDEPLESFLSKIMRSKFVRKMLASWRDESGKYCIALELCDWTVEELLMLDQSLSVFQRNEMMLDACKGLSFYHLRRIVHRDINTRNYLMKGPKILLADLGHAEFLKDDNTCNIKHQRKGDSGFWCAPDLLVGKPTKKVDVYPLGIVYFLLLSRGLEGDFGGIVKQLVQLMKKPEWKTDAEGVFRRWDYSKSFCGCSSMLVKLLKATPNERATLDEFMEFLRREMANSK